MISEYLDTYTYEYLLNNALAQVPDSLDKREGSIIYDALAPACYELAAYYMELKKLVDASFIATATGTFLDYRAQEQGLTRYAATAAKRRGDFTTELGTAATIPIGSRFSTVNGADSVNFYVDSVYTDSEGAVVPGSYNLVCEQVGTIGNSYTGTLLPISNITALATATLSTVITPARDAETDDELRERYLERVNEKAFGGNVAQYNAEIKAIAGVGDVQVYPIWNGGGTVKCSVIDSDFNTVSEDFIAQIQNQIDPPPHGTGLGTAPIGHTVTITTPTELSISVRSTITVDGSHTLSQLEQDIVAAIEAYMLKLRKSWGNATPTYTYSLSVYLARVNAAILSVGGVVNVQNTLLNGSAVDITLLENSTTQQLPVLGEVSLTSG